MIDAEIGDQIKGTRKKVYSVRKGNSKQKKNVQYMSIRPSGKSKKRNKDTETFGTKFGMQMITDQSGDRRINLLLIFLVYNKLWQYLEMLLHKITSKLK